MGEEKTPRFMRNKEIHCTYLDRLQGGMQVVVIPSVVEKGALDREDPSQFAERPQIKCALALQQS